MAQGKAKAKAKHQVRRVPVPEGCPLTRGQYDVVKLLDDDRGTISEVAKALSLTQSAVRQHKSDALKRLRVDTLASAKLKLKLHMWWDEEPFADPLVLSQPWLAAYINEFTASRWPHDPDQSTDMGMKLALAGHRNAAKRKPPTDSAGG